MSKRFHAVNRITGERWSPKNGDSSKQFLVMFDSGYLGVVTREFYTYLEPLDPRIWETVLHNNLTNKKKEQEHGST